MPFNWSIQNTKAIITFEANKNSRETEAKLQLDKAMSVLTENSRGQTPYFPTMICNK